MDYAKESLKLHEKWKGKIEVVETVPVKSKEDLALAYTPGVAEPCLAIQKDVNKSYDLTRRHNMCLVVTDGSAVLGLGNIGPEAGMPVMEGKCVLFKAFGGVDAFPMCIKSQDVDTIVETIYQVSGSFGGVNLEDISAPRCFEIEKRLKEKCDIPIFHDDQHGTAIITLAGLMNALKVTGKELDKVKIVMNGAGAAAIAIAKLLITSGAKDVTMCDRTGATTFAPPALASSGNISGVGLAQANTMASWFIVFTMSTVSAFGADTPINTSAPLTISARLPCSFLKLVIFAISSFTGFIPASLPS